MALRFGLLKELEPDSSPSLRDRSEFEAYFLDFPREEELVRYLRDPDVVKFSQIVLLPLRDVVMLVRDRFRNNGPLPRDSPWIRRQLSEYMRLIVGYSAVLSFSGAD